VNISADQLTPFVNALSPPTYQKWRGSLDSSPTHGTEKCSHLNPSPHSDIKRLRVAKDLVLGNGLVLAPWLARMHR
jgi:hypothetical protein